MDSLKFEFGLNHCKCTGDTSNKSGFLSQDPSLGPVMIILEEAPAPPSNVP